MLTRRDTLRSLFASPVAFLAGAQTPRPPQTYGYLDLAEAKRRGYLPARVTLDGADVSDRCYACDDTLGIAWLFKVNAEEKKFYDYDRARDGAAREVRYGHVVFTPRAETKGA